jgi:hypothetical protein
MDIKSIRVKELLCVEKPIIYLHFYPYSCLKCRETLGSVKKWAGHKGKIYLFTIKRDDTNAC